MTLRIDRIDHFVLTVVDIEATCRFYECALGFRTITFEGGRKALRFGRHKINLHQVGRELDLRAARPTPGSGDFCLVTETPMDEIVRHLDEVGVAIEEGPGGRSGAEGAITSLYIRDPEQNLVEIAIYGRA